jgi:glycosyltransferase involved in cell wall biosynthesis
MLSLTSDIEDSPFIKYLNKKAQFISFLNSKIEGRVTKDKIKEFGLFSYPILGSDLSKLSQVIEADIIYLHWAIGGLLTLGGIEKLLKLGKPVVMFMHDMWSITGGCHYSFDCEKFKVHCHNCQNFPPNKKIDLSFIEFNKKAKLFNKYENIYFISPSTWLYNQAKSSLLTARKPIYYISNVLNKRLFQPINKRECRKLLDIDPLAITIAFGAASIDNPYKGWKYLQEALTIFKHHNGNKNILILIFGGVYNKKIADNIHFPIKFLGRLRDDYSTALAYNAANVFVAPSLADNLPTTVMESLACGTPVTGFDVGGIPNMIQHKQNGYLAKYKDSKDLADGIIYCIENNILGSIEATFNEDQIIDKHLALFKELNLGI